MFAIFLYLLSRWLIDTKRGGSLCVFRGIKLDSSNNFLKYLFINRIKISLVTHWSADKESDSREGRSIYLLKLSDSRLNAPRVVGCCHPQRPSKSPKYEQGSLYIYFLLSFILLLFFLIYFLFFFLPPSREMLSLPPAC